MPEDRYPSNHSKRAVPESLPRLHFRKRSIASFFAPQNDIRCTGFSRPTNKGRPMRNLAMTLTAMESNDAAPRPGHRVDPTFRVAQFGQQRWPSGPIWNPGGQARSNPWFGQQCCPSGPRCHPTGHARLAAKGWQKPLGPRHHPGPQSSAALAVPAKLVRLVTATASAALKIKVLSILISSNLVL
jgi:hypothetical protein